MIWSKEVDSVLSMGISMDSLGVKNWALTRGQALEAIHHLSSIHIAILGGDVVTEERNCLAPTYDNWYCNRVSEESDDDYVRRSAEVARRYVQDYRETLARRALFAIVPQLISHS
jgi:hypothetical protein